MSQSTTIIGIDLAKRNFHYVGLNEQGKKVTSIKLKRDEVLLHFENEVPKDVVIAMEACSGCHFWAGELQKLGFQNTRILKPSDVKVYAKSKQKNDMNDALAIAKASKDPELKAVHGKTQQEQEIHFIHKIRSQTIQERVRKSNALMAELLEFGYDANCGKSQFARQCASKVTQAYEEKYISLRMHTLFMKEAQHIQDLLQKEKELDQEIMALNKTSHKAKLLQTIPGIGPVNASILSIAPVESYPTAKDFAASLGIVPSQHTTGGKVHLRGITKKGSRYMRTMLIQGGRSLVMRARIDKNPTDKIVKWAQNLLKTKAFNQVCVAVANKLARISYACLTKNQSYQGA